MPTIFAALRFMGWHGIIAVVVLVFYEGVPLVKSLPGIGWVPVISDLAKGRVDHAYDAGALAERLEWQEKERRIALRRDEERRSTQAEIDRIEAEYWARRTDQEIALADLEKALLAERADHAHINPGTCSRPISKRLRDQLAPLGR